MGYIEYFLHLAVFVVIYATLSLSLNLAAGRAGLISLAHAGFFGIGAYTGAILSTRFGVSFWFNLPLAMMVIGLFALAIGLMVSRLTDDLFMIATLGISVLLNVLMNNWNEMTRGPLGISGIPSTLLLDKILPEKLAWLFVGCIILLITYMIVKRLGDSAYGRVLRALSEDEVFARCLGKNVAFVKMQVFVVTAVLAAVPGVFFAHYVGFVDPSSFGITEGVYILAIVVVGGLGRFLGGIVAATVLVLLPEALRFVADGLAGAAQVRQILFGILLVGTLFYQRQVTRRSLNSIENEP